MFAKHYMYPRKSYLYNKHEKPNLNSFVVMGNFQFAGLVCDRQMDGQTDRWTTVKQYCVIFQCGRIKRCPQRHKQKENRVYI